MGKRTRYIALPDQSYDPRITDLRKPFNVPGSATGPLAVDPSGQFAGSNTSPWVNRNVTNQFPIQLAAGVPVRVLANNVRRSGLIIANKDATNTLTYSFTTQPDAVTGFYIGPGGSVLLDFTCPVDSVWLLSTAANLLAMVAEFSRSVS